MEPDIVLKEFLGGASLGRLSQKYAMEKMKVREMLIGGLGHGLYLKTVHANGGKAVARKLMNSDYRANYVKKMSLSVKESIGTKMQTKTFREAWMKKAGLGSVKGIEKLRLAMDDPKFHKDWVVKCKIAGMNCYLKQAGIHKANPTARRKWSICGLKKTGKKLAGPRGEKMYNNLEVSVAQILDSLKVDYIYEKIIAVENKNGFISVDFVLPQIPNLFIEVTYWSNSLEKMGELRKKWKLIKSKYPDAKMIVVTQPKRMDEYGALSQTDINVFTPIKLKQYIAKTPN